MTMVSTLRSAVRSARRRKAGQPRAARFFRLVTPTVLTVDARSAELAKLFRNMYHCIEFAVSKFVMIAAQHGRDISPILDAVKTGYKRGGSKAPGRTGGRCHKDGFFLTANFPYKELIARAGKIQETMPAYLVDQVRAWKPIDGSKGAILGRAFKKNIDDPRSSLAYKLRKILLSEGVEVHLHVPPPPDPSLYAAHQWQGGALHSDAAPRVGLCALVSQLRAPAPPPAPICAPQ
jgi:UDP-N-acetyl-D-mannosaminuronate dehydrogenase